MKTMQENAGHAFVFSLRSVQFGVVDLAPASTFFLRPWGLEVMARTSGSIYLRTAGSGGYAISLHQRDTTEALRDDFRAASRAALDEKHVAPQAADVQCSDVAPLSEPGGAARHDAPLKLSHLALHTPRPGVLEAFYAGARGFRVVDRRRKISFLNRNADHHTFAAEAFSAPAAS